MADCQVEQASRSRSAGTAPAHPADLSARSTIGGILVERGRLAAHDAERIVRLQQERGLRFGEAAIVLGLLTLDDVRQALSHQFDYPCLPLGDTTLDRSLVAAYQPFGPSGEDLRALRSQLLLRWFDAGANRRTLAIVSAGAGEGRSYIAANLAIVLSQLGERTLVLDADLRNPCQHRLFKLANQVGLSDLLSGRCESGAVVAIAALRGLSVLPAGAMPPNPQELLGRPGFAALLQKLREQFDVIILDTPAASEFADAHTAAKRAGAAVLVTRQHASSLPRAAELARNLQEYGVSVVGAVLNRSVAARPR
jgi:chain length determinant protein tyrosine kinase EpsG